MNAKFIIRNRSKINFIILVIVGMTISILLYVLPSFALIKYSLYLGEGTSIYGSFSNLVFLPLACFVSGLFVGYLARKKYKTNQKYLFLVVPSLYLWLLVLLLSFLINRKEFLDIFKMIFIWFTFVYFISYLGVIIGEKSILKKFISWFE